MPKWSLSRRSVERYIAFATDVVSRRMKRREAVVESVRADIIAREAETWLKSNLELEARLCAIISGKVQFERAVRTSKGIENVKCHPTCTEVINAINLLLKLRGVYKAADGKIDPAENIFAIMVGNDEEKKMIEEIVEQGKIKKEDTEAV